ncbi:MAG: sigma-70 family RNA polymerase sigma factor [Oscillospiraceae bacterium]|nr:sigma-70 family RNA polymerase sigma factor [Oscillospiraceae bacterium]
MTEASILDRLCARDETALEALARRYGPLAKSVAQRILQNPQDAEECVQDGLMAVWETVPPLRPDSLRSYFVTLVRNRALDCYRAERRDKRGGGAILAPLEELGDLAAPGSVEDEAAARMLEERINEFLARLPERERKLFLHRYYFMESVAEIGEFYGLTPHQVSVLLHRTRKKLKRFMKEEDLL